MLAMGKVTKQTYTNAFLMGIEITKEKARATFDVGHGYVTIELDFEESEQITKDAYYDAPPYYELEISAEGDARIARSSR